MPIDFKMTEKELEIGEREKRDEMGGFIVDRMKANQKLERQSTFFENTGLQNASLISAKLSWV
jgi:hypothetical protein